MAVNRSTKLGTMLSGRKLLEFESTCSNPSNGSRQFYRNMSTTFGVIPFTLTDRHTDSNRCIILSHFGHHSCGALYAFRKEK